MRYVFDTYALMSYLRREKSFHIVRSIIVDALQGRHTTHLSVINMGELFYMQSRKSSTARAESSLRFVLRAGINVEPATTDRVIRAARLKAKVSLSYADAFAASLAEELTATLVTGDPEYKPLEPGLKILWL